jgi:hypothetical protein
VILLIRNELLKARVLLIWTVLASALLTVFAYAVPITSELAATPETAKEVTAVAWGYVPMYVAGVGRVAAPVLGTLVGIMLALGEVRWRTAYSSAVVSKGWIRAGFSKTVAGGVTVVLCVVAMLVTAYVMCAVGALVRPSELGVSAPTTVGLARSASALALAGTGFMLWTGVGWLIGSAFFTFPYSLIAAAVWLFVEQFVYYPFLPGSIHMGAMEGRIDYLPGGYTALWPPLDATALPSWTLIVAAALLHALGLGVWVARHKHLPVNAAL